MARHPLTPDDEKVWRFVTRHVNAFRERAARHPEPDENTARDVVRAAKSAPIEAPVRSVPRSQPALVLGGTADIDRRTAQRFKRGDMAVDGRLDLHGLSLDQAHGALLAFVHSAAARGARCVVVVTGKGKGPGAGPYIGKIRRETPHWLNQPPLRALVLAVSEARARDGGGGALYVLLKRKRGD